MAKKITPKKKPTIKVAKKVKVQSIVLVLSKKGKENGITVQINGMNVMEIARAIQVLSEALGDILMKGPDYCIN